MSRILITGANGFVGSALAGELVKRSYPIRLAGRIARENLYPLHNLKGQAEWISIGELGPGTDWSTALEQVSCVVHLAARVHIMKDVAADPLAEFQRVNTAGTERLARCAAQAGLKRLIFMSTIKVNGEETAGRPFTESDSARPCDAYGASKWEAEQALARIARDSGLEVVILRSPLVYGPGVKGNFRSMMAWINKGFPLPMGAVHNLRSLVALDNLVDLILICIDHPAAANKTFLVSDGEDVSTAELLRRLGRALGKPARLFPVPTRFIEVGAAMLGMKPIARRLCGTLQVDISHTCNTLGWMPPVTMDESLKRTADDFLLSVSGNKRG